MIVATVTKQLQRQALEQLHGNHKDVDKTRLLAHESIYWVNMNNSIENTIKMFPYVLIQQMKPKRDYFITKNLTNEW